MTNVISAQNLDLTFQPNDGPVHALKDVALPIDKGEFVGAVVVYVVTDDKVFMA